MRLPTYTPTIKQVTNVGTGAKFLILGILGIAMMVFVATNPDSNLQLPLLLLLVLPAILMSVSDSPKLMPYVITVWGYYALIRRLADWAQESYSKIPLLNLAPVIVSMTLLIPILRRKNPFSLPLKRALFCLTVAISYGALVGLVRNGFATIYELGNYVAPMILFVYLAGSDMSQGRREKIIRSFAALALITAIYGWFQFTVAPPWDTFWMKKVQMISNGLPEPGKIRIFSTQFAAGVAAGYLVYGLLILLAERRWRNSLSWLSMIVIGSALLLTQVRAVYLLFPIGLGVYLSTSSSRARTRTVISLLLGLLTVYFILPSLPGQGLIFKRFNSLGNLSGDRSISVRTMFIAKLVPQILADPIGKGIGITGSGTKLNNNGKLGEDAVIDNGLAALLFTFGFGGTLLYVIGLGLLYVAMKYNVRPRSPLFDCSRLGRAVYWATMGTFIFGNPMSTPNGFIFWLFCGLGITAMPEQIPQAIPEENVPQQALVSKSDTVLS